MSPSKGISTADLGDRHRRYFVFALLALGLLHAFSAATHFVGPGPTAMLDVLQVVMAIAMLGFVAPIFLWKMRASSDEWSLYRRADGFIEDALSQAHIASWSVTFVLLALFTLLDETLAEVPARVQLEGITAAMLIVLSAVFLFVSRVPEEDEPESLPHA